MMEDTGKTLLSDVVKIEYADKDNAVFTDKDGFISLKYKNENGIEKEYDRVFLHRVFPHEMTEKYVSVCDREENEICMIRDLADFDGQTQTVLSRELKRRYHVFRIEKICSVKEKYGYSYWKIKDENGDREFTVSDTYRSITKINSDRLYVTDVDGNRYEIPSLSALDRASCRKIELFL